MEDEDEELQEEHSSPVADNGPAAAGNSAVVDPRPNEQEKGGESQSTDYCGQTLNGPITMLLISDLIEPRPETKAKPEPRPAPKARDADD